MPRYYEVFIDRPTVWWKRRSLETNRIKVDRWMDGWRIALPLCTRNVPGLGRPGRFTTRTKGAHHQMIQIDSSGYQHQLQGHVPTEQAKLDVSPSDLPFVLPKKACNTVGALPITH